MTEQSSHNSVSADSAQVGHSLALQEAQLERHESMLRHFSGQMGVVLQKTADLGRLLSPPAASPAVNPPPAAPTAPPQPLQEPPEKALPNPEVFTKTGKLECGQGSA